MQRTRVSFETRGIGWVQTATLSFLALLLLVELAFSLTWRISHDTPLMHYMAFLIDRHDFVPYRDVYETSMPGTFLFHVLIGKFFGYGDFVFRCVDVVFVLALCTCTWRLVRPFGPRAGVAAALFFPLWYLAGGPAMGLQRDCVGILPIVLAMLAAGGGDGLARPRCRAFLIGLFFGISASIKPHLAIGLPAVLAYFVANLSDPQPTRGGRIRELTRVGAFAGAGFLCSFAVPMLWLWWRGGLPAFLEMFFSYLPLHLELAGDHTTLRGLDKWLYLIKGYRSLGGRTVLLFPASLGIYLALLETEARTRTRRLAILLTAMAFLYSIYPVFSGQFWDYHWMPFLYFVSLCGALILVPAASSAQTRLRSIVPCAVFLFFVFIGLPPADPFVRAVIGQPEPLLKDGRVDAIASFLKENLREGDRVQPLDWTGGSIHAMLLAEAVIATPYIHDYYFYHHVSEAHIQELRRRFIDGLHAGPPRFVIDVSATPRPNGFDTTREFRELRAFLEEDYSPVHRGEGYVILERRRSAP